jgi:hypothetical protein
VGTASGEGFDPCNEISSSQGQTLRDIFPLTTLVGKHPLLGRSFDQC